MGRIPNLRCCGFGLGICLFVLGIRLFHHFHSFHFSLSNLPPPPIQTAKPPQTTPLPPDFTTYTPHFSSNNRFLSVSSYLINGDATSRLGGSQRTTDIMFVLLGIGDFSSKAQSKHDEYAGIPPYVPSNFQCVLESTGEIFDPNAYLHSTGTAFDKSIGSHGNVRYFGERVVLISCIVAQGTLSLFGSSQFENGQVALDRIKIVATGEEGQVDLGFTRPRWYVSTSPQKDTVLCSTAVYGLSGSRWLTEWVFYHHFVQEFDKIELYMMMEHNGAKTIQTLLHLLKTNSDWLRAANWSSVIRPELLDRKQGLHRLGVHASGGFEHGQRLARTDCYLRNRNSKFIAFLDVDELFFTPQAHINFKRDVVFALCNNTLVCQFESKTTFPVLSENPQPGGLFFPTLNAYSEPKCVQGFNCGDLHFGRQKYLTKGNKGGPFTVLAIHSITDSFSFAKSVPHIVVPSPLAFVRHYNPTPYKNLGGYGNSKGILHAFPPHALELIRKQIANDSLLQAWCDDPKQEDEFLKFDHGADAFRFGGEIKKEKEN